MRSCSKCGESFREEDEERDPALDLGEMFLEHMEDEAAEDVCPKCKEELGIFNLLGFGE
jgi:hypothetical protein